MQGPTDQTERLLERGAKLLRRGRPHEASLVYGRILLRDPSHAAARDGRERAAEGVAERERTARETLDRAAEALTAGDRQEARQLIRHALRDGADTERAHVLLDRLDGRTGRIRDVPPGSPPVGDLPAPRRPFSWSRPFLASLWVGVLALAAVSVASSFDRLVGRLAGPPVPAARSAGGAR
ncbi:MAG TPA: hypothetical protein VIC87_03090 [Vicinamibacteria bacterium]|jgi:hypothetical protein